jgi:dTDP-4-dehydrorhamnose 3,5-epimerase
MDIINIQDVLITPLKIVNHPLGNIYHAIRSDSDGYNGFGEAYFSSIVFQSIKGWKRHREMTLNIIVISGEIKFVLYDDRENSLTNGKFSEIILSPENYNRITIPPNIWMAFQGLSQNPNILLNVANIKHIPTEAENLPINNSKFEKYEWK